MKSLNFGKILFLIISINTHICLSQSSLQFNTVITQVGTISGGYGQSIATATFTVPAGKVWKLERYTRGKLWINGTPIRDDYSIGQGVFFDTTPIWLNSGDSFHLLLGGTPYVWTENWYFSLLEFNK